MPEELVNVRYMVDDVEDAVAFYTANFGFSVRSNAAPAFADVVRGNLRLLLSGPKSSAGRPMPDGRTPGPGGWNRMHFIVDDIAAEVERRDFAGRGRAAVGLCQIVGQRREVLAIGLHRQIRGVPLDREKLQEAGDSRVHARVQDSGFRSTASAER